MNEQLAYEHVADLRRDAAAHPRAVSRADRARPRVTARAGRWTGLRRSHVPAGCQA